MADAAVFAQAGFALRLDWGRRGAEETAPGCDVAVVVDVLSFTTALSVAADRGIAVLPCPWRDDRAAELARRRDAMVAVRRSEAGPGQVSLAPGTIRAAVDVERLVLPSPNGSTISAALADRVPVVVGACLRNRRAVAGWLLARRREQNGLVVGLVAAGEQWPDGTLRPAVEDLWGVGAVASALITGGWPDVAPEATSAAAAFEAVAADLPAALHRCVSGRELAAVGHREDVDIAAELDASSVVPELVGEAFVRSSIRPPGPPPRPSSAAGRPPSRRGGWAT